MQKKQSPIIMNCADNRQVVDQMIKCKVYDLFMEQSKRVRTDRARLLMQHYDQREGVLYFFLLFLNHPKPKDNGFFMTFIPDAAGLDSEILDAIKAIVQDSGRDRELKTLYLDTPEIRN